MAFLCCHIAFWILCGCRCLCHDTESDFFLFISVCVLELIYLLKFHPALYFLLSFKNVGSNQTITMQTRFVNLSVWLKPECRNHSGCGYDFRVPTTTLTDSCSLLLIPNSATMYIKLEVSYPLANMAFRVFYFSLPLSSLCGVLSDNCVLVWGHWLSYSVITTVAGYHIDCSYSGVLSNSYSCSERVVYNLLLRSLTVIIEFCRLCGAVELTLHLGLDLQLKILFFWVRIPLHDSGVWFLWSTVRKCDWPDK